MFGPTVLTMVAFQVLLLTSDTLTQITGLPDKPVKTMFYCTGTGLVCEYGYTPDILELRRGRADACPKIDADPILCDRDISSTAVFHYFRIGVEVFWLYPPDGYAIGCGLTTYGMVKYVCKFSGFYPTTPTKSTQSPPTTTTITTRTTTTTEAPMTPSKQPSSTEYMPSTLASGASTAKTDGSTSETEESTQLSTTQSSSVTPKLPIEGGVAERLSSADKTKLIVGLSVAGVVIILLIIIIAETRRRRKQRKNREIHKEDQMSNHPYAEDFSRKEDDMREKSESRAAIVNETPPTGGRERMFKKRGADNKAFIEEVRSDKNFPETDSELTVDDGKLSSRDSGVGDAIYTDADVSQDFSDPDDGREVIHEFSDPDEGPIDKSSEKDEIPSTPEQGSVRVERRHVSFADSSVNTDKVVQANTDSMSRTLDGDRLPTPSRSDNEAGVSGPESEDEVLY